MKLSELIEELKKYPEDDEIEYCWECSKRYNTLTIIIDDKHIEISELL